MEVERDLFVELEREGEDLIWTVLGEFGEADSPVPDLASGIPGPAHNQIPEPDLTVNNTTIWTSDFSQLYFDNLLFEVTTGATSMANWYIKQSANRYAVNGDVTDWAQVPYNAAAYGRNYCGSIVCARHGVSSDHSIDAWYDAQIAAGLQRPKSMLTWLDSTFGTAMIWMVTATLMSLTAISTTSSPSTPAKVKRPAAAPRVRCDLEPSLVRPTGRRRAPMTPAPTSSAVLASAEQYWIGDYTIEPENGGVGVFAHEFGHDLGLPDLYDTSGNTGGAENSTGFWTMMSSGSYGNTGIAEEGIGSKPIHDVAHGKRSSWVGSNYEVVGYAVREVELQAWACTTAIPSMPSGLSSCCLTKKWTSTVGDPYRRRLFLLLGFGQQSRQYDDPRISPSRRRTHANGTSQFRYRARLGLCLPRGHDGGAMDRLIPTSSTNTNPYGRRLR